jgi:Holliday junction resolvasome RuvABC DNA-binding subunit
MAQKVIVFIVFTVRSSTFMHQFGFQKRQERPWIAERLLAFEEWFFFTDLIT